MIHVSLNLQATTSFCIVDKVLVETLAQHSTIKASPMLITFQQHENRQVMKPQYHLSLCLAIFLLLTIHCTLKNLHVTKANKKQASSHFATPR